MALLEMFPASAGSVPTALAQGVTATATSVAVVNADVLPEGPNLATLGMEENAEVIYYGAKDGNTLTGCLRGHGGTLPQVWLAGTEVYRAYTALDHDRFVGNIKGLDGRVEEAEATLGTLGEPAFAEFGTGSAEVARGNHGHTLAALGAAASGHTHTLADLGAAASGHTHTRGSLGLGATLWSGSLAVGASITLPELASYTMIMGVASGMNLFGRPTGSVLYLGGVFGDAAFTYHRTIAAILSTTNGTTWKLDSCGYENHLPSGQHGALTALTLNTLYGIA